MRPLHLLFSLALPLLAAAACAAQTPTAQQALRSGSQALAAGRYDEAERWLRAAVSASPDNPEALMALGVAQLRLGQPAPAADSLRKSIALAPAQQAANLFLGIACVQMHNVPEAVAALNRELELDPTDAQAAMWLGVVQLQDGHPEKAVAPLDRAAELAPNDLNILEYRGKAHSDVAYASYARMAAIDPDSWHVHKVQGQMLAQQNLHKEAIAEFQQAIRVAPANSDLYEELAAEYRKTGALDLAQQAYARELELSPNNTVALFNLGKIDIETNRTQQGLELLQKIAALADTMPALDFYLGLGQLDSGDTKAALASLEKARSLHPEPELAPRIEFQLARVYRKLGRLDDANRAARAYAQLKAQNAKLNPRALQAISSGFGAAELPRPPQAGDKP